MAIMETVGVVQKGEEGCPERAKELLQLAERWQGYGRAGLLMRGTAIGGMQCTARATPSAPFDDLGWFNLGRCAADSVQRQLP